MIDEQLSISDDLRQFIISQIRKEGPATFARFMEWCLYHPAYGYYGSGEARIGREGDYYTAPCVHPFFGGMVAKQLSQMSGILGSETFTVWEVGGGRGLLCEAIVAWAKKNDPSFYDRLAYCIVEPSPRFLKEQRERLFLEGEKGKVRWLSPDALTEGEAALEGCVLSNELVDAFPVHRVVCEGGELKEIHVGEKGGRFFEIPKKVSDPRIIAYLADGNIDLLNGRTIEVNLRALKWLEDVGRRLQRGFLMTIDYGCLTQELHDPSPRNGVLRWYFSAPVSDNPYERPGRQDITSHVDFTSLIRKGEELELRFTGLVPQYRFLIALGLLDEIKEAVKAMSEVDGLRLRLSLKHLIEPERGMGEIFKVLIQHKGIEKPDLRGLKSLRDISVAL